MNVGYQLFFGQASRHGWMHDLRDATFRSQFLIATSFYNNAHSQNDWTLESTMGKELALFACNKLSSLQFHLSDALLRSEPA